jgi:hypothetical protein
MIVAIALAGADLDQRGRAQSPASFDEPRIAARQ